MRDIGASCAVGVFGALGDYQCEKFYFIAVKKEELKSHLEVFHRVLDY